MFVVFSYIERKKVPVALSNVYKLLKPGGLFVFDVVNGSQLDAKFEKTIIVEGDDVTIVWDRTKKPEKQLIDAYAKIHADKVYDDHQIFCYYYPEEIKSILQEIGFSEVEVYSDYMGNKNYTKSKTKLCIVCRK